MRIVKKILTAKILTALADAFCNPFLGLVDAVDRLFDRLQSIHLTKPVARGQRLIYALLKSEGRATREIKWLVRHGADLGQTYCASGETPLAIATWKNTPVSFIKMLIDHGADVNAVSDTYNHARTALMRATESVDPGITAALLDAGADIDAGDLFNRRALHHAIQQKATDIGLLLIKRGADVNAESNNRGTPLMAAAEAGTAEIAEALLTAGADVNVTFSGNIVKTDKPLDLAYAKHHFNVAALIEAKIDAPARLIREEEARLQDVERQTSDAHKPVVVDIVAVPLRFKTRRAAIGGTA